MIVYVVEETSACDAQCPVMQGIYSSAAFATAVSERLDRNDGMVTKVFAYEVDR